MTLEELINYQILKTEHLDITVSSIGIVLIVERNLQMNDIIQLEDETVGKVIRIGLRTSKLKTRDDVILVVPNSKFVNDTIINWSQMDYNTRFSVEVGVAYGSGTKLVSAILFDCAIKNKNISAHPKPFVRFNDFGDLMLFDEVKKIGISLFASAGVAGVIIGLAAQRVIGAVLAGIQIAIAQPIRLDDVVVIEGEWGRIEEITLTYVVVSIWDQRRLVVPSTYFFEKTFQNWTRTSAEILGTVFIYTDYHVSFDTLRKELTRLLESTPLWDKRVNVLQVTDAKQNSVEVRALMSAKDSPTAWDLRVYVREKLIEFLQKNYPESLPKTRILLENKPEKT